MDWQDILGVPNPSCPVVYGVYRAGNGPVPHDPCLGTGSASSVCASSGCHVCSGGCWTHAGSKHGGKGVQGVAGHTEQSQRKFLPCYPRIVKTEPTQHILDVSKGILGLPAFLNEREVWSGGVLMNQYGLVMLELLSKPSEVQGGVEVAP